jgi:hypothetical protein
MQTVNLAETPNPSRPVARTLQAEGACIGLAAIFAYAQTDGSWLMFALLLLAPDLLMLGYLGGNRIGAIVYNIAHSYVGPVALGVLAYGFSHPLLMQLALIWIAHIGLDRGIGYGLKYAAGFRETHLGRA